MTERGFALTAMALICGCTLSPFSFPTTTGFVSQKVTVNGIGLHYWLGGDPDGDPVILWHGFLATGYVWREVGPLPSK
jgi:hypothetical protein